MRNEVPHGKIGHRFDDDELDMVKELAGRRGVSFTLPSGVPRMQSGVPRLSSGVPRLSSGVPRLSSGVPRQLSRTSSEVVPYNFIRQFVEVAFETLHEKLDHVRKHSKPPPNLYYATECFAWMYGLLAELVAVLGGGNMYDKTGDKLIDGVIKFSVGMPAELAESTSGADPVHMARLRPLFQDHNIALRNKNVHNIFVDRAFRAMSSRGKPAAIASFAALLDMYLATVSSYKIFRWREDDVPVFMSCRHTVHMLVTLKLLESGKLRYPASYSDVLTGACKADSPERDCNARSTARWNSAGSRVLRAASKMIEKPLPGEPLRTFNSPSSTW